MAHNLRRTRCTPPCRAAGGDAALLLEVDGVLCDLHSDGHRQAFNRAFHELGYDCVNWSLHVYNDLLNVGDGTGEGLVAAYYEAVGWPTFLPTSEQDTFARNVHALKRKMLRKMLAAGEVPLRQDITQVIDQAVTAGATVACISETLSEPEDGVVDAMLAQLGAARAQHVRVFASSLHSTPGEDGAGGNDAGAGRHSSLEESMAAAAAKRKQADAAALVHQMQAEAARMGGFAVGLAPHLQSGNVALGVSPRWLAAVAQILQVPASNCLVVAANGPTIRASAAAGMVAVAVPRKQAYQASYPEARAKFEGFGPGYATWGRLASLLPVKAA